MKSRIITIICMLWAVTCYSTQVPIEKARITARNFYLERINIHDHRDQVTVTGEFTIEKAGQPVYYIFNMDQEGFIIISAEEESFPVLGYSFEGVYTGNSINPAFNYWMDNYSKQILAIRENSYQADESTRQAWNEYGSETGIRNSDEITVVDPLLTATWHQDFPYNTNCPVHVNAPDTNIIVLGGLSINPHHHCWTGCVATAMSMIINYWRYPVHGHGTHSDTTYYGINYIDFENTYYDWNGMLDCPTTENDPVAKLIYQCGVSINTNYSFISSSANYDYLTDAYLDHFQYDSSLVFVDRSENYSDWVNTLMSDLNNGWPIQYFGLGNEGSHSFVCDGYQGDFFHMNWGWGGIYNGFFNLNNLNPYTFTFNNYQEAVLHIHPKNSANYPLNCSGQTDLMINANGSVEDGSGPVYDYLNNRDCTWLIAPDDSISSLTLNFRKFNLHQSDTLKIYDGENSGAPLIGSFTGAVLPESITASGQKLFLRFITDDSLSAKGFLIEYISTLFPFCNDTVVYTDLTGTIDDGSGRFNYRNGSNCVWKIQSPWNDVIHLNFTQIDTETNRDTINIYDLSGSTFIASYGGSYPQLPDTLNIEGPGILIVFKTDSSFRKSGWSANYSIGAVGTNDNESSCFKIYPNPASGYTIIETTPELLKTTLILMNSEGKILQTHSLCSPTTYLNLGKIKSGIYFIRIKTDHDVFTQKLVVY